MSVLDGVLDKSVNLLIDMAPKLVNLSKNERDSYRKKIDKTYKLFDEVIMLILNKLGTIKSLPIGDKDEFLINYVFLMMFKDGLKKKEKSVFANQ
jgi:hypothetical protein